MLVETKMSLPGWLGNSKWVESEGEISDYIIWDGSSRFYAQKSGRPRFFFIYFVPGMYPNTGKDQKVLPNEFESHYLGVTLLGLSKGYSLGISPGIDDGK